LARKYEEFKEKVFKLKVPGRKVIAIIRKKAGSRGGEFSNIVAFYHVNEYKQAAEDFNRKFKKGGAVTGGAKEPEVALPGAQTGQGETKPAGSSW
jgi:hypothetical protein